MRLRTQVVIGAVHALVEDLLKNLRANCKPEAKEERIHERIAEPNCSGDDVSVGQFERAA